MSDDKLHMYHDTQGHLMLHSARPWSHHFARFAAALGKSDEIPKPAEYQHLPIDQKLKQQATESNFQVSCEKKRYRFRFDSRGFEEIGESGLHRIFGETPETRDSRDPRPEEEINRLLAKHSQRVLEIESDDRGRRFLLFASAFGLRYSPWVYDFCSTGVRVRYTEPKKKKPRKGKKP